MRAKIRIAEVAAEQDAAALHEAQPLLDSIEDALEIAELAVQWQQRAVLDAAARLETLLDATDA